MPCHGQRRGRRVLANAHVIGDRFGDLSIQPWKILSPQYDHLASSAPLPQSLHKQSGPVVEVSARSWRARCQQQSFFPLARPLRSVMKLIAAGMLIMAGDGTSTPLDYQELERWTRVGYERGMRSRKGREVTESGNLSARLRVVQCFDPSDWAACQPGLHGGRHRREAGRCYRRTTSRRSDAAAQPQRWRACVQRLFIRRVCRWFRRPAHTGTLHSHTQASG
jgi:hypothetical protein